MDEFHADVFSGSLCIAVPERFGPASSHLNGGLFFVSTCLEYVIEEVLLEVLRHFVLLL